MPLLPHLSGKDNGGPQSLASALKMVEEFHLEIRAHQKKIADLKGPDPTGAVHVYAYADELLCWTMDLMKRILVTEKSEHEAETVSHIYGAMLSMQSQLDAEIKKLQDILPSMG